MEYLIKHSRSTKEKEISILNSNRDFLLKISRKLSSIDGKEVIYDATDNIVYLIDTFERKENYQCIIYDASSKEILTIYLSKTFSGLDLYVSSTDNIYTVTHRMDMSSIHLYKYGEIAGTIQLKKNLIGNSYVVNIKPQIDETFMYLFAFIITRLLEYKKGDLKAS